MPIQVPAFPGLTGRVALVTGANHGINALQPVFGLRERRVRAAAPQTGLRE
jgi:hypothetical protein